MDAKTRDMREHDSRTRLAETCGARDESPSSNLGRAKQGEAIRADVMKPRVSGRWPDVHDLQTPRRMSAHMLCPGPWEGRNRSSGEEESKTHPSQRR